MSTPQSDQCPGCGKEITENYCAHCGEKKTSKLKTKDIMLDILADGTSIEIPLFTTLKGMFTRPGEVALDYINGARRKYYRPFQYYFMFLSIYLLVFYFMGDFEKFYAVLEKENILQGESDAHYDLIRQIQLRQAVMFRWLIFLMIPISSLLTYLFFMKHKFSFVEHVALNLYLLAQSLIFSTIEVGLQQFDAVLATVIGFLFSIFYTAWGARGFFKESWTSVILKAVVINILALVLFGLSIGIVSALSVVLGF